MSATARGPKDAAIIVLDAGHVVIVTLQTPGQCQLGTAISDYGAPREEGGLGQTWLPSRVVMTIGVRVPPGKGGPFLSGPYLVPCLRNWTLLKNWDLPGF